MSSEVEKKVDAKRVWKEKLAELKRRARRRGMGYLDYALMCSAFYETTLRKGIIREDIQNRLWYAVTLISAVANYLRYKDERNYNSAMKQIEKIEKRLGISCSALKALLESCRNKRTKSCRLAIMQELVKITAELATVAKDFDPEKIDARVKS